MFDAIGDRQQIDRGFLNQLDGVAGKDPMGGVGIDFLGAFGF
jgi:hypothetical protein